MSRAATWWNKLGLEPKCFGGYVPGDVRCDGYAKKCSHLTPCKVWRPISEMTKDPSALRDLIGDGFVPMLYSRCKQGLLRNAKLPQSHLELWGNFLDAFRSVLPVGLNVLAPSMETATFGSLAIFTDGGEGEIPNFWGLYERTATGLYCIARYNPRPLTRLAPSVSINMTSKQLEAFCPWATRFGESWVERKTSDLPLLVTGVEPEHLMVLARMLGLAWSRNRLKGQINADDRTPVTEKLGD